MDRRTQLDDMQAELEHQCFNLFPERWGSLYREQMLPGVSSSDGTPVSVSSASDEIPVTDPADLDAWYENLERQRRISGAQAPGGLDHILGLADGEGVLV